MKMSKQELITHAMSVITNVTQFEIVVAFIETGKITSAKQIDEWQDL